MRGGTRTAPSGTSGSSGTRRRDRRSPSLVHAEPDDVAVTTSVSQGVSALVSALDLSGERNRIVISEYEFPTVGQIAHAQELRGAEVVHVRPEDDGRISLERFAEAIDERTALVCCTAVSFRSGHRNDVSAIAQLAHERGALVLADSYQAVGALELDVRTLGADVITGGTVKYLLGSAGLGFMWMRESLRAYSAADADRLVRGRGHLRHVHRRLLAARDRATLRQRHAARALALPRCRGDAGRSPRRACPQIEGHVRGLVDRLLDRSRRARGARSRLPAGSGTYGPLICVVSTDPVALVDALAGEADRHLDPRRQPADLAPPLQRRGGRRPHPRGVAQALAPARLSRSAAILARMDAATRRPSSRRRSSATTPPGTLTTSRRS